MGETWASSAATSSSPMLETEKTNCSTKPRSARSRSSRSEELRQSSSADGPETEEARHAVAHQLESPGIHRLSGHPLDLGQRGRRLGRPPRDGRPAVGGHGWPPSTVRIEPVVYDERSLAR